MSETTRTLRGLVVGDGADAWRAAGFLVEDDLVVAGGVALRLVGDAGPRGLLRWAPEPPTSADGDGLLPAAAGEIPADTPTEATHPNGVVGLDHVVVTTDDLERTTAALGELGLEARRTVVGLRGDDEIAYRFFPMGTCLLELVGPTGPTGEGPARLAGLAFTSTAVERLGDLAGPPRDAVQPGRRIATLRGEGLGISVPVAFLSPRRRGQA